MIGREASVEVHINPPRSKPVSSSFLDLPINLGRVTVLLVTRRVSEGEFSCRFFLAYASGYRSFALFLRLKKSQPRFSCRYFLAYASGYHSSVLFLRLKNHSLDA